MTMEQIIESCIAELDSGNQFKAIISVFGDIEIAEEEIAKMKTAYPEMAKTIDSAFLLLVKPETMNEFADSKLYRAHCFEILDRVANGVKGRALDIATDAEVIAILYHTSLRAPLTNDATCLYYQLYTRLFGADGISRLFKNEDEAVANLFLPLPSYSTALDELRASINNKAAYSMRIKNRKSIKDSMEQKL